jgi:hypothetical protein
VSRASLVVTTLLRVKVAIVRVEEALGKTSSTACTRVQYPSAMCGRIVHIVLIVGEDITECLSAHLSAISICLTNSFKFSIFSSVICMLPLVSNL